jgi:hypothetical protein
MNLFLGFNFQDFAIPVMAATRANGVRQVHFPAVLASYQIARGERVVGAAAIAAALRQFTFRMRGHFVLLSVFFNRLRLAGAFNSQECLPFGRRTDYT